MSPSVFDWILRVVDSWVVSVACTFLVLSLPGMGQSPNKTRSVSSKKIQVEKEEPLVGGCILGKPLGKVPENVHQVSGVEETDQYGPFPKKISACGIVLAADTAVPDVFLNLVGKAIGEVFRKDTGVDIPLQKKVISHLYRYKALLPVPMNERSFERLLRRHSKAIEKVQRENSLCDIIMARAPEGQVMEVVEHILHAITDVGLHYEFPNDWGISNKSKLWVAMQKAIRNGYYDIRSYDNLKREDEPEIYRRVILQEFAYWFISTAWNLQEPYGPNEPEWTIRNRAQLKEKLPKFFAVYKKTVERVMSAPSLSTLAKIGPRRREEGRSRRR